MFSTDRILRRGAIALACFAGLGGTALAETLVVRAGGPSAQSFPAGKKLASGSRITLAAGDTLTILDSKGTRTLRGPITFSPEAGAGPQTNASFARLISTQNRRRARTGAVRGGQSEARPTSLWDVDTTRGATTCVADGATPRLWRADKDMPATFTLTNESTGQSARVVFATGVQEASWPAAALPVAEGARYTVGRAGGVPLRFTLTRVTANPKDPAATAITLREKGCQAQYDLLVAVLSGPETVL